MRISRSKFAACQDRGYAVKCAQWRGNWQYTCTIYIMVVVHRLTQVGILRAFTWPGFFLSTFLGSRVTQPAIEELAERLGILCVQDMFEMLERVRNKDEAST